MNFEYTYFTQNNLMSCGVIKINLCFVIGKIVSDIEFEFIINSKHISIGIFEIELSNNSIIKVKGYNEIADYCYQKLIKGDIVGIYGELNRGMEIIIHELNIFYF